MLLSSADAQMTADRKRIRIARFTFSFDAVLGVLAVAGACLYAAAYNRHAAVWPLILTVFVPFSLLWSLFCYGAYKGLTSERTALKFVFWCHVVLNAFSFPIGTVIAGVSIWLWRGLGKREATPASA